MLAPNGGDKIWAALDLMTIAAIHTTNAAMGDNVDDLMRKFGLESPTEFDDSQRNEKIMCNSPGEWWENLAAEIYKNRLYTEY